MTDDLLKSQILALLDDKRAESDCNCSRCSQVRELLAKTFECEHCGYRGAPALAECACYDARCPGGSAGRGAGCFHGGVYCPACDDAEADPWFILRRIRAIVSQAASNPETLTLF